MQTFIGVLYHNENDAEGMTSILKELHKYVPHIGKGHNREYADQAIVGDQLTVADYIKLSITSSIELVLL